MADEETTTEVAAQAAVSEAAQPAAEAQPQADAAPAAEAARPEADAPAVTSTLLGDAAAEQEAAKESAPAESAPEEYAPFKDAQGNDVKLDDYQSFTAAAKELGLPQEKAQKMFSAMYAEADGYVRRRTQEFAAKWAEQSKADPEFGGAGFRQNLGQIAAAYQQFATPELKHLLDASGLGNHPEVMRLFYRVGKALSQDTGVRAQGAPEAQHRMFPKSNMVI